MKKLNTMIAAIVVIAVVVFVLKAMPSLIDNILMDIITKR